MKAFQRRKKAEETESEDTESDVTFYDCVSADQLIVASSTVVDATEVQSIRRDADDQDSAKGDQPRQPGAGETKPYSRKVAPRGKAKLQEAARKQFVTHMRSYFDEVDAYELAVESPTPTPARLPADKSPAAGLDDNQQQQQAGTSPASARRGRNLYGQLQPLPTLHEHGTASALVPGGAVDAAAAAVAATTPVPAASTSHMEEGCGISPTRMYQKQQQAPRRTRHAIVASSSATTTSRTALSPATGVASTATTFGSEDDDYGSGSDDAGSSGSDYYLSPYLSPGRGRDSVSSSPGHSDLPGEDSKGRQPASTTTAAGRRASLGGGLVALDRLASPGGDLLPLSPGAGVAAPGSGVSSMLQATGQITPGSVRRRSRPGSLGLSRRSSIITTPNAGGRAGGVGSSSPASAAAAGPTPSGLPMPEVPSNLRRLVLHSAAHRRALAMEDVMEGTETLGSSSSDGGRLDAPGCTATTATDSAESEAGSSPSSASPRPEAAQSPCPEAAQSPCPEAAQSPCPEAAQTPASGAPPAASAEELAEEPGATATVAAASTGAAAAPGGGRRPVLAEVDANTPPAGGCRGKQVQIKAKQQQQQEEAQCRGSELASPAAAAQPCARAPPAAAPAAARPPMRGRAAKAQQGAGAVCQPDGDLEGQEAEEALCDRVHHQLVLEAPDSVADAMGPEEQGEEKDGVGQWHGERVEKVAEEEVEVVAREPLEELLHVCGQQMPLDSLPSMDELLKQHVRDIKSIKKIGEGTFGEAFKGPDCVFKIVPMEGQTLVNGEVQKQAHELLAEVVIAMHLSSLRKPDNGAESFTPGFVETHGVAVCRGKYSATLVREWRRWDKQHGSENDPVDVFDKSQLYVVFVVANGGSDLEHSELRSFEEARSLLLQATLTLAVGEATCGFEHRDLHWGNLLIQRTEKQELRARLRGMDVHYPTEGLAITLIDFTLSRLEVAAGRIAFFDLETDPELFDGPKGDCQADTYRRMRSATKRRWCDFCPGTNCMWLHYTANTLLTAKQFPMSGRQKKQLQGFRRRALQCKSCADLVWDELFSACFSVQQPTAGSNAATAPAQ